MRGKADDISNYYLKLRITPAYAGKSNIQFCTHLQHGDHPRLCGEKTVGIYKTPVTSGSPPPMRGKVREWEEYEPDEEDHPRLCGEKSVFLAEFDSISGSPPPMRGKVTTSSRFFSSRRITPAYAGKRAAAWRKIKWR